MTKVTCISNGNETKKRIGALCAFFFLLAALSFPAVVEDWGEVIVAYALVLA